MKAPLFLHLPPRSKCCHKLMFIITVKFYTLNMHLYICKNYIAQ